MSNETLETKPTRRTILKALLALAVTSLLPKGSRSRGPDIPKEAGSTTEEERYKEDKVVLETLEREASINILFHNFAAVRRNDQWVLHPIGEMALEAGMLLLEEVVRTRSEQGLETSIRIVSGGEVPYGDQTMSDIFANYLAARIAASSVSLDTVKIIWEAPEDTNKGYSTGGELAYAGSVFQEPFISIAPIPHRFRIELLARRKGLNVRCISTDGIIYHLGNYEKYRDYIREAWLKFSLYELAARAYITFFDREGKGLEERARRLREEENPPVYW